MISSGAQAGVFVSILVYIPAARPVIIISPKALEVNVTDCGTGSL